MVDYLCQTSLQDKLVQPEPVSDVVIRRDKSILQHLRTLHFPPNKSLKTIVGMLNLLLNSESAYNEVISYYYSMHIMYELAIEQAYPDHTTATDNKTRKHWIILRASMGTELLYLATFYFQTGNVSKYLEISREVMVLASYFSDDTGTLTPEQRAMYTDGYAGPGNPSIHRLRKVFTGFICFDFGQEQICLHHLQPEISKQYNNLQIPPLPYAVFLYFLCCHELGDAKRRDAALRDLIVLKYHNLQGGHRYWIVHTLLGICYQTIGDNRRAIRRYQDSAQMKTDFHEFNPAKERIKALQESSVV